MKNALVTFFVFITLMGCSQSYEEVKQFIYDSTDIQHKDIVLKQSILETGWFKSYNCRINHNLFGFRHKSKVTPKNKMGYFIFDDWRESVRYYEEWQNKYYKGGDYFTFLRNIGYATDPEYVKKLKGIKLR